MDTNLGGWSCREGVLLIVLLAIQTMRRSRGMKCTGQGRAASDRNWGFVMMGMGRPSPWS